MRRVLIPGGGWIVLAALAVPILVRSARPLTKKLGQGLRDIGDKIVEASTEAPEPTVEAPSTEEPKVAAKPRKPRAKAAAAASPSKKARTRPKNSLG